MDDIAQLLNDKLTDISKSIISLTGKIEGMNATMVERDKRNEERQAAHIERFAEIHEAFNHDKADNEKHFKRLDAQIDENTAFINKIRGAKWLISFIVMLLSALGGFIGSWATYFFKH